MIGILALQGGFALHQQALMRLGSETRLIKKREQLAGLKGLIIPGGESSVLLHLLAKDFRSDLCERVRHGLPLLVTCAGLILIAAQVENPDQESLGLLPITVRRNDYGRQIDSVIVRDIPLKKGSQQEDLDTLIEEAVFIRAPRITASAQSVDILAKRGNDPVLVRYKNIIGATFHPELSQDSAVILEVAFPWLRKG